jgi:hypothetical protein
MTTIDLLTTVAACAAMPPLYSWADCRVGGGGENALGPLGGRSLGFIGGGLLGAALGYAAAGPWGASIGLFWVPYRSLDFKRGAAAPTTGRERRNAVLRHVLALLAVGPVYLLGGAWLTTAVTMAGYAAFASFAAIGLGRALIDAQRTGKPWDDEWNNSVERRRGFAYGVAMAIACAVGAMS